MKKRLLIISTEVSGMNKYLFGALADLGWEIIIEDIPNPFLCRWLAIFLSFDINMQRWKKRFEIYYMKVCKMEWVFKERTKYAQRAIQKHAGKFDLIFQISSMFAPFFDLQQPKGIAGLQNRKYVLMIDYTTSLSKNYPGWAPFRSELKKRLFLEKLVLVNAELIFSTSENTRRSLIEHYGVDPKKVVTTGYGLNLDDLKVFNKEYDGKTILFIGMDFERKGGFVLLEAFKKVREEIPQARLIIIGPNKDIYRIEGEGVESLGNISDRKMIEKFYEEASLFVMPSLCEPFGLVFLEAMSYKIPCIAANRDAMPEIIQDGKNGFLVPPGDSQALANRIIFLLKDKVYMKQLGENARDFVEKNFLWKKVVSRIEHSLTGIV